MDMTVKTQLYCQLYVTRQLHVSANTILVIIRLDTRPWPVAETQTNYDVYTVTKADRCGSQLPLLLTAITTPQ